MASSPPPVASADRATVRARSSQETVEYLEVFRPGARKELEALVPEGHLERLFSYSKSSYLPLEVDAIMGRGIVTLLGPDESVRFWSRHVTHHFDAPILATMVKTAVTVLGANPGSIFRWMPKAMPLIFRDAFTLTVESAEPRRAVMRFEVTSETFWREPVYALVLESIGHAVLSVMRAKGQVRMHRDEAARVFRLETSWD